MEKKLLTKKEREALLVSCREALNALLYDLGGNASEVSDGDLIVMAANLCWMSEASNLH